MIKNALIAGAAIAGALALSAPAQATNYFSGSLTALAPNGVTETDTFTAATGTVVDVLVQDCCIVGDNYTLYLDGAAIGTTPAEPLYGTTLSQATFQATLGSEPSDIHSFYLVDQVTTILPAGVFVSVDSAAPEPATWALMMAGVGGMGAALRIRRRKAVAA